MTESRYHCNVLRLGPCRRRLRAEVRGCSAWADARAGFLGDMGVGKRGGLGFWAEGWATRKLPLPLKSLPPFLSIFTSQHLFSLCRGPSYTGQKEEAQPPTHTSAWTRGPGNVILGLVRLTHRDQSMSHWSLPSFRPPERDRKSLVGRGPGGGDVERREARFPPLEETHWCSGRLKLSLLAELVSSTVLLKN